MSQGVNFSPNDARAVTEWTEIQRRPLTRSEADLVSGEIRRSGAITGYSMAEWTGQRDTFVLFRPETGEIVGTVLVHHLWGRWSEIAVVYILEGHRGRGYGRSALQAVLRTLKSDGRRKLLFFSDEVMTRLAEDSGFEIFESEADFIQRRPDRWLFLKVFYKIQWIASLYRIRELRRKRRELGSDFSFKIGVLRP